MTTHSSILTWRIPWTEKPSGLRSIELQRVGHDWSNLVCTHTVAWNIWKLKLTLDRGVQGPWSTLLSVQTPGNQSFPWGHWQAWELSAWLWPSLSKHGAPESWPEGMCVDSAGEVDWSSLPQPASRSLELEDNPASLTTSHKSLLLWYSGPAVWKTSWKDSIPWHGFSAGYHLLSASLVSRAYIHYLL